MSVLRHSFLLQRDYLRDFNLSDGDLKYSHVSLATMPLNVIRAIMFGKAISPLKISAIVHTAETVM